MLLLAARGAGIDEVLDVLRLDAGELAGIVGASIPAPAPPLPAGDETYIPDEINLPVREVGPYQARQRLVLVRDVSEPAAAALAGLAPGKRGIILFCAGRGDGRHEVAAMLKISVDEVDDLLNADDGEHLVRPDR